jgi:3-methyladenine DNA glycosylase AlkD
MNQLESLISRVSQTTHGFTDILRAANELAESETLEQRTQLAQALFASEVEQAHMLATYLFGQLAVHNPVMLQFMRETISADPSWRVQEILAQAFDAYCKAIGYETTLPTIEDWLHDYRANVRRAVSEGLRIWTSKPYFRNHPEKAIQLLATLHADSSEYVRKSVGNALRDISRKHPDLIAAEIAGWDQTDKPTLQTYRLASTFLNT